MDRIEPLISSTATGPLGISHLPRLWLKLLLHDAGLLPDGYRAGEGGFDGALCERFGIDGSALIAYVKNERPDYIALEKWFVANAKDLGPATVAAWNAHVGSTKLQPERAALWRERFGLTDEGYALGTKLNDLDDWAGFHARVTASTSE